MESESGRAGLQSGKSSFFGQSIWRSDGAAGALPAGASRRYVGAIGVGVEFVSPEKLSRCFANLEAHGRTGGRGPESGVRLCGMSGEGGRLRAGAGPVEGIRERKSERARDS